MSILRITLSAILLISLTQAIPLLKDDGSSGDVTVRADSVDYRLPETVTPSHYVIKLKPTFVEGDFKFTGESSIKITISGKDQKKIVIHTKDLEIDNSTITLVTTTKPPTTLKPTTVEHDFPKDFFTMNFKDVLAAGEYILNIKYTGLLHNDMNGFYRSSYTSQGKTEWLATTQFEPTWARRAFPCFDEPAMKATFEISINHDNAYKARSNMPLKNITPDTDDSDRWWSNFDVTPSMSTYLIAFVISKFDYTVNDGKDFRVWSQPDFINKTCYALDVGEKELKELTKYMGVEHSDKIKKMDNFAIPHFRAGAMENWGIVTYRESSLLYEENVTSTDAKQGIATVISHEFAHQWFGNLVSPFWWDYTWLNEGFANYFQYFITNKVETTWRLMDQFVTKNLQEAAFKADDKEDQHPMNGAVNKPEEISAFFDTITYSKAGCVIRMFSHALTEKVFQSGLQSYLTENKHKAAKSDHLFTELIAAATAGKVPIKKEYLESWATQRGYPVITVTRDYKAKSAVINQHRFLTKAPSKPATEAWYVPINYANAKNLSFEDTKPTLWLEKLVDKNTTIKDLNDGWYIFNNQQTGYYRVNYDAENWKLIIKHLNTDKYTDIHVINRAQLLDDSFNLAQANELSDHSVFLEMTKYLEQEVDYVPWNAAFRAFGAMNRVLTNTGKHTLFKLYILRIINKLEKTVGYTETDKDEHLTKFNRINAINWACHAGSKSCVSAVLKQLEEHVAGKKKLSADLRGVVLCAGVRASDSKTGDKMMELYKTTKDEAERKDILAAVGCSKDSKILKSLLASSIAEGSIINPNDALKSVVAGSSSGPDVAFDFINEQFDKITAKDTKAVVQLLNEIASRMNTKAQLDKLEKFITSHKTVAEELKKTALVRVNDNIAWIKANEKQIGTFLDSQKLVDPPVVPKPSTENKDNSSGVTLPVLQLILGALAASVVSQFH